MSRSNRVRVKRESRRALQRRNYALLALAIIILLACLFALLRTKGMLPANEAAEDWYELKKEDKVLVRLPADDAAHDNYTEWWYYNGHLQGANGHNYSFHYAVFLLNALAVHTVVHASFLDEESGRRYNYQTRTGGNPSSGKKDRFDFTIGDWVMSGAKGEDRIQGKTDDFSFNLDLKSQLPPVFQGGTGLLDFKKAGTSYYYSRTRMTMDGYAGVGGHVQPVTGVAWFDHQWGDFRTTVFGWEWFAVQLDDGTDIMLYQLYDGDKRPMLVSGTVTRGGHTRVLSKTDVVAVAQGDWLSPVSGVQYPLEWLIEIPEDKIKINLTPVHRASEFDGRKTTYNLYWEGAMRVSGSHQGKGFLEVKPLSELTGASQ
jgi:predicted secreted hydrolase